MQGMRKFWATILGILSFTAIMILNHSIDPFNLGMGLGLLLTPFAFGNAVEHKVEVKK